MKKNILLVLSLVSFSCIKTAEQDTHQKHTVVVILEAKPGKEDVLKNELLNVKKLSQKEPACIEYHVHQDTANPAKFILYENWTSKEEHAKQFQKPYILEFAGQLKDLLAKPYEGVMAKELN